MRKSCQNRIQIVSFVKIVKRASSRWKVLFFHASKRTVWSEPSNLHELRLIGRFAINQRHESHTANARGIRMVYKPFSQKRSS